MKLESIQIASPRPFAASSIGTSGLFKEPVDQVRITFEGLEGDTVVNKKHHGGPDQAVYVYSRDDYDYWEAELGRSLAGGEFSENLTFSTMAHDDSPVRIGDRYQIGDAVLEVAAPRVPCNVFQAKMDEPDWVRRFRDAGRPGYYCRVITEGTVAAGDAVTRTPAPEENITSAAAFDLYYDRNVSASTLRAALKSPVAIRVREHWEQQLARK